MRAFIRGRHGKNNKSVANTRLSLLRTGGNKHAGSQTASQISVPSACSTNPTRDTFKIAISSWNIYFNKKAGATRRSRENILRKEKEKKALCCSYSINSPSPSDSPLPDVAARVAGMASPLPSTTSSPMPIVASAVPSLPLPTITDGPSNLSSGASPFNRSSERQRQRPHPPQRTQQR